MIEIINRQKKRPVRTRELRRLVEGLVARYRPADPDLTVAFVGADAIRTLNRKFMKKDKPTDVLSFPLGKAGPDGRFYLGDIVIAVPVAARQAREKGHGLERELKTLVIHGFLHLLGYNHGAGIGQEERAARERFL
jgi:probable rRNA maturation factor